MNRAEIAKAAAFWWHDSLADTGRGRAARAALRHLQSPAEALAVPATHELNKRLGGMVDQGDRLALIAISLANLRETDKATAAERMGETLSPIRFQRLIRIDTPAELITPLRRALAQIGNRAQVGALAADLYFWSEAVRTRWCFSYYGARTAAPEQPLEETSE